MRGIAFSTLAGHVDPSQFGAGFGGASCEMASLLVHGICCAGSATKQTVVKIYVDVVQAYASIMASMSLPLDENHRVARERLATLASMKQSSTLSSRTHGTKRSGMERRSIHVLS